MFEIIRANQRKSAVLIILMGIILVGLGFLVGVVFEPEYGGFWGVAIALGVWLILLLISFSAGKDIMLSISGAKPITYDVHPQLYNVVEEMRIAAGLNVTPKIYIINTEMPNAFATGLKPQNSAIAVTAGLLSRCNRDELQGVVAHEMSHIINRDIRFMTISGIMLGTIVIISQIFLRGMFFSGGGRRDSKGGGQGQIIIMIVALVFAILAPILAQLLYFAISRKREYLADASAARLTRYPEGLASALEKISNSDAVMTQANKVTAPMYIINPLKRNNKRVSDLSSTHPPISERIRILRSMAGGAGYKEYQQAYQSVGHKATIIPNSCMMDSTDFPLRQGLTGDAANAKTTARATGDIMMAVDNFQFINCGCGLKIKIPPKFEGNVVYCPRCGAQHPIRK